MKKYTFVLPLMISALLIITLFACSSDKEKFDNKITLKSINEIKNVLESGDTTVKEDPFIVRTFNPVINDEWVGNGVSYGCYRDGQFPGKIGPSKEEILEDLNIIAKDWKLIRVYGADTDTKNILEVIKTNNLPIKMILGVWLEPEDDNPDKMKANIDQVLDGINLANEYSETVLAISVGNETQVYWSWHKMNPDNLIKYIRAIRSGVSVPITTADDYNFWNKPESKQVASEIDFIMTHMHPLWNGKQVENSMIWVDEVYREVESIHNNRIVIIGETGWATNYNAKKTGDGQQGTLMKGEVSEKAQADYLTLHNHWVDSTKIMTFLFEAFDEPWKGGGEDSGPKEVEKHWGVYNEDRTPKESFVKYQESKNK